MKLPPPRKKATAFKTASVVKSTLLVAIGVCCLNQFTLSDHALKLASVGNIAQDSKKRVLREFVDCSTTPGAHDIKKKKNRPSNEGFKPCALLFFGLARQFRHVVLPSIRKNILEVAGNGRCDIYLHNYNTTSISNPRTGESDNVIDPNEVYDLTSNVVMDTTEDFLAKRNMSYYAAPHMRPHKRLGWDQTALENMYKQVNTKRKLHRTEDCSDCGN